MKKFIINDIDDVITIIDYLAGTKSFIKYLSKNNCDVAYNNEHYYYSYTVSKYDVNGDIDTIYDNLIYNVVDIIHDYLYKHYDVVVNNKFGFDYLLNDLMNNYGFFELNPID